MPMVYQWYPKLIAMLPSDGYTAPKSIKLTFKDDMGGTPAYAMGNDLSLSLPFFRSQLKGEAKGCVVHEMSHIVQGYGRASATNPHPSPTPGWVVEGIADYIRWFLYEPQSKGAEITKRNIANAKYNDSYRTTANFINWVVLTYDKDFLRKINAAARAGTAVYDRRRQETAYYHALLPSALGLRMAGGTGGVAGMTFSIDSAGSQPRVLVAKAT